tara:strand:- start:246 stop:533 length:288 start_codon:yes stop_codon:yes gene_type:complete
MNQEEYEELLSETQSQVQEFIYAMDSLREFDTMEMESSIKKLWKHRGNKDRTIDKSQIKDMLQELNIIDRVAKDCGVLDDIISADVTDFGRCEED